MYNTVFSFHAELLKALAHPKRLEILQLLRHQKLFVSEIQQMLGLPQANLSQHLQVLRDAGVLATQRQGKYILYFVAHKNFIKACDLIRAVLIERFDGTQLAEELTLSMEELTPLVHDPVCQMRLSPTTASFVSEYQGKTYYFCASGCLEEFTHHAKRYID